MHTHAYSYAYMHICENTCTHIHMHAHTRTHTHTLCVCGFMKMAWVVTRESDLFVIGWIVYFFNITFMVDWTLTLFVPSNLEWVTSPSPSNIGAKRSKVGLGQEKPDINADISTVNIAVLPSLSDTMSLSYSPIYSESSTNPSSESSTSCSLSSFMKSIYPTLQTLTSHCIYADLNVKTTQ